MSNDALRQGFRDILEDPALLLIEISWRWLFGVVAILISALSIFFALGTISLNQHSLATLANLNPLEAAETIFAGLQRVAGAVARVAPITILTIALFWITVATVGRYSTLLRPALAPGAHLRRCLGLNALRAGFSLTAAVSGIAITVLAGFIGGASAGGPPNIALLTLILFPLLAVIAFAWTIGNWYLSLAYLFQGRSLLRSLEQAWRFTRSNKDEVLEISLVIGVMRAAAMIFAFLLSVAVAAVVGGPRLAVANIVAVTLLYFLASDFLYMARLLAFARLRSYKPTISQSGLQLDKIPV